MPAADRLDGVDLPIGVPDVKAARVAAFGVDEREASERAVHALENSSPLIRWRAVDATAWPVLAPDSASSSSS